MSDSREIIQEVSGFYPLFEALLKHYKDLQAPAVFGVVWRYCQMEDGVCKASLRTIADILDIDEVTVMRRLKVLCDDGFLIDTTPDLRNKPHVYADAGLVVMKSNIGVVESASHRNATASHRNTSASHRNATVSESQLIKDSNKDLNKELNREEERNPLFSFYENKVGFLTPLMADAIEKAEKDYSAMWVTEAIEVAAKNGARSWNYCAAVLDRWKHEGKADRQTKGRKQTAAQSGDSSKYLEGQYADYIEH
jgi:DnaD/phage-associated family protein